MEQYQVPVRNEFTGEIRTVVVLSGDVGEAQIAALRKLFREEGWRKATAMLPESCVEQIA